MICEGPRAFLSVSRICYTGEVPFWNNFTKDTHCARFRICRDGPGFVHRGNVGSAYRWAGRVATGDGGEAEGNISADVRFTIAVFS